jgi:SAM-dependent methyltransferase
VGLAQTQPVTNTSSEDLQRAHYDRIAAGYEAHYSDGDSLLYRQRFINEPLTEGLSLTGKQVLDAMCGSGQMAAYLLGQQAQVTGLDISPEVTQQLETKLPNVRAVCRSILDSGFPDATFDAVFAVGGLHHLHPNLAPAMAEICRILKPGGHLCFAEPHARSVPDALRRVWYRFDPLFESNEAAVDVEALMDAYQDRFEFLRTRYTGGLAYLLVYNSMVFRASHRLKRLYTPALLRLEALTQRVQGRRLSCLVLAQWRKRPLSGETPG